MIGGAVRTGVVALRTTQLRQRRRRIRVQPEREGDDDLHVIHVRTVAAVQPDTLADFVVVQGVFFEDGLDTCINRCGGRAEQFDYFWQRHPYLAARYADRFSFYPDCVPFHIFLI